VVYKAFDVQKNNTVAVKKIPILNEYEGIPVTTLREIVLLKGLDHPYIVKLIDFIIENQKIYMIFEYHKCDLDIYLKN